jgi:protein-tyrosine phosphatase
MTRGHLGAAPELVPAAIRRTFTLREYARLLGQIDPARLPAGTPGERARASLPLAAALRRQGDAVNDDVDDPYRQGEMAYAQAYAGIEHAVRNIAKVLNPG